MVNIDSTFLIYDIFSGKQLKRYEISINRGYNLYKGKTNIIKWDNNNDNEFLLNLNGNIVLFELMNENNLTIIAQTYSQHIHNLQKLNKKSLSQHFSILMMTMVITKDIIKIVIFIFIEFKFYLLL